MQLQRSHQAPALQRTPLLPHEELCTEASAPGSGRGRRLGSGHSILGRLGSMDLRRALYGIVVKHKVVLPHLQGAVPFSVIIAPVHHLTSLLCLREQHKQVNPDLEHRLRLANIQTVSTGRRATHVYAGS